MSTAPTPVSSAASAAEFVRPARVQSVDLLRGLVMAFMALDHVRDFFTNLRFAPEDLSQTYAGLFLTRWLTHFSAPTFFLLAGTGAYLYGRTRTTAEVSKFLWTRGLFLVAMEFTIIFWGWTFMFPLPGLGMLVIWALGVSMICMSQIIKLPMKAIAAFAIVMIAGHNLLDGIKLENLGHFKGLWMILHHSGWWQIGSKPMAPGAPPFGFFILYPLVPWMGVMAAGYALGTVFTWTPARRRKFLLTLGTCVTALFIVLRATNIYGNAPVGAGVASPGPFVPQATMEKTIIAFLNVEKYPPSLDFLLMTLGPGLILLALTDSWDFKGALGKLLQPIVVIGKVPMFYYILHLYLIHTMAIVVAIAFGQPWKWLFPGGFMTGPLPDGYGHGLPFIWFIWALCVAILYFPCHWYARYKATHKYRWLSYI
jgi:uncharacterized membrane protein